MVKPLRDSYVTLWLHQVHQWFANERPIVPFLRAAKDAGVTSVMTDLPWAWTEREAEGQMGFTAFRKDWYGEACALGLKLQFVISMREFPPWASRARFGDGLSEAADPQCRASVGELWTPSMANATTARLVHSYFGATVQHLVATYGTCVAGISPTLNNEFETRYTQSYACARDYSNASLAEYERWQLTLQTPRGGEGAAGKPLAPPVIGRFPFCVPRTNVQFHRWLEFREQFLASQYELLCKRVQASGAHCFLHFGEFFASTDLLNSNLFFTLAKSPYVDELIMDSNMALLGAASSPSVVGLLVSTARGYGKTVHYEAATERVIPCDSEGRFTEGNPEAQRAAKLLYSQGIARALESGLDSLGFTNLCEPRLLSSLMPSNVSLLEARAMHAPPTAVLYVPYRALYAYNFVVSGRRCRAHEPKLPPLPCWARDFSKLPRFGWGLEDMAGMCAQDVMQHALLEVWDDLRERHAFIAVIGTAERLSVQLLQTATERVLVRFAGVMGETKWSFAGGEEELTRFNHAQRHRLKARFPFREVVVPEPASSTTRHFSSKRHG